MFAAGKTAAATAANYIEDVFSTYLYTGNGSTQTINNGIDLSTKGGLVWIGSRAAGAKWFLMDSVAQMLLDTATTASGGSGYVPTYFNFNSNGFFVDQSGVNWNINATNYVSWTFRKQAKFFDVVTFTGDGSASLAVNHNLGSVPGCVIVKRTDSGGGWFVWHRATSGTPNNDYIRLEQTSAVASATNAWSGNAFTSTQFFVSNNLSTNVGGATYVAYLFAHNAGGFGLTGTDNVISCGSYTGNGSTSGPTVSLGYEPQWLLVKRASGGTGNWILIDSMRGFVNSTTATPSDAYLVPNTNAAESTWGAFTGTDNAAIPLATGFQIVTSTATLNNNGDTYIYIAIRRGPMKTPTSGTSVYESTTSPASGSPGFTAGFPVDFAWLKRPAFTGSNFWGSRLTGAAYLDTTDTAAEQASGNWTWDYQSGWFATGLGSTYRSWMIRRAPGFFDVVCYTGDGTSNRSITHNLGVAPEFLVVKSRSNVENWNVYDKDIASPLSNILFLNNTNGSSNYSNYWGTSAPTSTTFNVGNYSGVNGSGQTYVAYLFASVAGVSKVGSYSGTGATQTISCGFAARFVLIKRTDSTGNWVVWDTSRGMVAGTDPRLELNTTNAETNANWVYTDASGFQIVTTDATVNASGGSYIFWAVA